VHSPRCLALLVDHPATTTPCSGTHVGGVSKSADGADRWRAVNAGVTNLFTLALAIDPQAPATVYAAAYLTPATVFKSTDGGESWSAVNAGFRADGVRTLAIDPKASSTVYAGTGDPGVLN